MEAIFEEEKQRPLTLEMEKARGIIVKAINSARQECRIPAFLMEGIIADIHAQVVQQSRVELIQDVEMYLKEMKESQKEKEGEKNG